MNCQEITNKINEIKPLFSDFQANFLNKKITEAFKKRKEIDTKIEYILEETDPNQIAKRDRIATKLGLAWLGKFTEGVAWGRTANSKFLKLITEAGEIDANFTVFPLDATNFKDGYAWGQFEWAGISIWSPITRDGIVSQDTKYGRVVLDSETYFPVLEWASNDHKWLLAKPEGGYLSVDGVDRFSGATPFHDGRAWIKETIDSPWKLIDKVGKVIYSGEFAAVRPFSEGLSAVRIKEEHGSPWRFVDRDGQLLTDFYWGGDDMGDFHEDVVRAQMTGGVHYWQYFKRGGQKIEPLTDYSAQTEFKQICYNEAGDFHNGLARVVDHEYVQNNPSPVEVSYYVNHDDKKVFDRNFFRCTDFSEMAAAVQVEPNDTTPDNTDGGWIYINLGGEPLFPGDGVGGTKHFFKAGPFLDGVAKAQDQAGQSEYYINKKGEKVFA